MPVEGDNQSTINEYSSKILLNSSEFHNELINLLINEGNKESIETLSNLLLPITKLDATTCKGPVLPVNDIRGIDSRTYAKNERYLRCKLASLYRVIDLYGWNYDFDELQLLLHPLSQQLKRLAISCWSYQYSDGQKWENFLKSFLLLKHFHLDITLSTLPSYTINMKQILSKFETKFFFDSHWYFAIDYNPKADIKFVLYSLPWPIKYFHTILYNIETFSTITRMDPNYSTKNVQNLYIQLYNQVSNSTTMVNKNDGQRYYSNVESLILINRLSNDIDQSSKIIDDLCHTIDLTKIKSLKFDDFDHLQSPAIINIMNFIPNLLELKINFKIYLQHQDLISRISTIQTLILYLYLNLVTEDILTNCFSLLSKNIKNLTCITNGQTEILTLLKILYQFKFLNIEKLLLKINTTTFTHTFTNEFIQSIDRFMTKMFLDDKYDFMYKINDKKQLVLLF
ncbi:unnamed protein product [Rotaria sp. Silwood1]|nr:unnamed protein product [Rotaria sp. Silwood1]